MTELVCIAKFNAKVGQKESLKKELSSLIEITRSEEGCIEYNLSEEIVYAAANGPCWDLVFVEKWKSREAFDEHCEKEYISRFFKEVAPNLVQEMDVRLYRAF